MNSKSFSVNKLADPSGMIVFKDKLIFKAQDAVNAIRK